MNTEKLFLWIIAALAGFAAAQLNIGLGIALFLLLGGMAYFSKSNPLVNPMYEEEDFPEPSKQMQIMKSDDHRTPDRGKVNELAHLFRSNGYNPDTEIVLGDPPITIREILGAVVEIADAREVKDFSAVNDIPQMVENMHKYATEACEQFGERYLIIHYIAYGLVINTWFKEEAAVMNEIIKEIDAANSSVS